MSASTKSYGWTRARLAWRDVRGGRRPVGAREEHLRGAMEWLCRAHDAGGDGGVARSYLLRFSRAHERSGWLRSYPETTGYIIPTFYDYAAHAGDASYLARAETMARWEASVQMPSGAVQGGVISFAPVPAIFNTGQVLFGWARAHRETGAPAFLESARRAADFLVEAQDPDGAWRRHGSTFARPGVNLYDARTAWGLLEGSLVTGDPRHRAAAIRNLDYVLTRQRGNGWYEECCLDDNDHPLLHTIAYTMEGLLESGRILDEPRYVEAARRAADALLTLQRADGGLPGRFDASWRPAAGWSCLTGDAQTSIVWLRLFEMTGERRYLDSARRLNRYVATTQDRASDDPGIRGGIQGSDPIFGEYGPYEYLNWAAKFYADALLHEIRLAPGESW
ncbi:MAG TPA: hypothetical protein VFS09_13075 [Candidatus Eisenbacteria bacterium]|nr:hypothetical protein [Candidatus Eisenbacteria bacterium]